MLYQPNIYQNALTKKPAVYILTNILFIVRKINYCLMEICQDNTIKHFLQRQKLFLAPEIF